MGDHAQRPPVAVAGRLAVAAAGLVCAACGPSTPRSPLLEPAAEVGAVPAGEVAPGAGPRVAPAALTPPVVLDWMWIGGRDLRWRVDHVDEVIGLDAHRALVARSDGELRVLDLATGEAPVVVRAGDRHGHGGSAMVRAGGRIVVFTAHHPTEAWAIEPVTLAVIVVPLADPPGGYRSAMSLAVAVSPDGATLFVCDPARAPTLRDARTLAVLDRFPDVRACAGVEYIDGAHVVVRPPYGHQSSRQVALGGAALIAPTNGRVGPGGRRTSDADGATILSEADGAVLARHADVARTAAWLGDGSGLCAIEARAVSFWPAAPTQPKRTFAMPGVASRSWVIAGTSLVVVRFGAVRLGVVDVATGEVRTGDGGNLGDVTAVAPRGGQVVAVADRLRVWRDGRIVTTSDPVSAAMMTVAADDALVTGREGTFQVALASGRVTRRATGAGDVVDRAGDVAVWGAGGDLMTDAGEPWFAPSRRVWVAALDVSTSRVGLRSSEALYVADVRAHTVFGFQTAACDGDEELGFEPGGDRVVTFGRDEARLYDATHQVALGGVTFAGDLIHLAVFVPGAEQLVLVGARVYLWDLAAREVRAWALPAPVAGDRVTSVGVSPDGGELALGLGDGTVVWATLAGVRAHSVLLGIDDVTWRRPPRRRCKRGRLISAYAKLAAAADADVRCTSDGVDVRCTSRDDACDGCGDD